MANEMVKEGGVWRFRSQPKSYEEASYDLLPNGVENGSEAITKNNNVRWVYCAVAGCWIPEQFYDSGLAIQQDRSGTPKDLDFRTPQISDFSPLSNYDPRENGTGTIVDGTDESIITGNGDGNTTVGVGGTVYGLNDVLHCKVSVALVDSLEKGHLWLTS